MSFGETVTWQNVFLSKNYSLGQLSELFDIGLKSWSGNVGSVRIDEGVDNRLAIHCFI